MSQRLYIGLISSLLLIAIFYSLSRSLKAKDFSVNPESESARKLYIVSPFEWNLLNQDDQLWPKIFHKNFPITPLQSPKIYNFALRKLNRLDVSPWEFELIRSWAVLLNSGHHAALLRALLRESIEETNFTKAMKNFKYADYPRCHLFWMEALFRLSQLREAWRDDLLKMVSTCSAASEPFEWFYFVKAVQSENKKNIQELHAKIEEKQESFPEDSFGKFYFDQLSKLLDYAQSHQNAIQFGP